MRFLLVPAVVLTGISFASVAGAQSSYPMLMGVRPIAVQIGTASEVEVVARYNLRGAYQVLVVGGGVTGEVLPPETPAAADPATLPALATMKVRFTVAADAVPGVRDIKLATPSGVSTVGQLVVVRDPVIAETGDNNTLENAQAVTLPATVCGSIEANEDLDFFRFSVEAGTSLSFHVRSARLQDRLHDFQTHSDPILTLRNAQGTVLALVDNYFFADPLLAYTFPSAGDYVLEIRDVRYQGMADWYYSIEINPRPMVTTVFPLAVAPGAATPVELIGFNLPADPHAVLTPAGDATDGVQWTAPPLADGQPGNSVPVVVSRLPLVAELPSENGSPAAAQVIVAPCGINGRIESERDVDYYAFDAKAGEAYSFEVVARRYQSGMDPILRVLNDQGQPLLENDDGTWGKFTYQDPWVENWTAPADGRYLLEIRDLHLRGGPSLVYFLKVERSQPYFMLEIDTDKTILNPGNGGAIFARVYRKNGFAGEIHLAIDGLPPGVIASCGRILADGQDGCIILQAAADAPRGVADVQITGRGLHTLPDGSGLEVSAVSRPLQEYYSPGGGRWNYPVDTHTVSVNDPLDIRGVKVSTNAVALKPGEKTRIDVTVERREGYTGNITLDVIFQHLGSQFGNCLPKGVTLVDAESKTLLTNGESVGSIVLQAAADAPPVDRQQISVMANVSINFVMKATHSAEPVWISVSRPEPTQ
jgi:hypothetical protein